MTTHQTPLIDSHLKINTGNDNPGTPCVHKQRTNKCIFLISLHEKGKIERHFVREMLSISSRYLRVKENLSKERLLGNIKFTLQRQGTKTANLLNEGSKKPPFSFVYEDKSRYNLISQSSHHFGLWEVQQQLSQPAKFSPFVNSPWRSIPSQKLSMLQKVVVMETKAALPDSQKLSKLEKVVVMEVTLPG